MPISILLADDHAIVRQGLRVVLEADADFKIVAEASDGIEAIQLVKQLAPDVAVLDIMMSGLNGLDALRIIRERSPHTRVVMISMYGAVAFVAEALRCGALGYVLKGGQLTEIAAAVRAAIAGKRYLSAPLSERAVEAHIAEIQSTQRDPHEMLTPRERQVLQLAAEGMTCPQIGDRLLISERTAERHRANVMHKLDLHSQTDLVLYALRRGILPPAN
jgi:two-component system, NarL family, response regulator NreC